MQSIYKTEIGLYYERKGRYSTMLYDEVEIEAIKLALYNVGVFDDVGKEILLKSIAWLRDIYERELDAVYLKKAVWHIYAYLELGFPFESGEDEFRIVLNYMGKSVEEVFPESRRFNRELKLNKTNVRNLLGKWNSKLQSMKIEEAVSDIIKKIQEKQEGEYLYHSGKMIKGSEDKRLWEHTFKLYVKHDEAVFHDINRNKYYILTERRTDGENSNC